MTQIELINAVFYNYQINEKQNNQCSIKNKTLNASCLF